MSLCKTSELAQRDEPRRRRVTPAAFGCQCSGRARDGSATDLVADGARALRLAVATNDLDAPRLADAESNLERVSRRRVDGALRRRRDSLDETGVEGRLLEPCRRALCVEERRARRSDDGDFAARLVREEGALAHVGHEPERHERERDEPAQKRALAC